VSKKTIARKAFTDSGITGEFPEIAGELAIAYGEDAIAPAREVSKFQKTMKDKIAIMGGVFENRFASAEEMKTVALIPSQQVLYGQFVNLINSPIQRFVTVLDRIAEAKGA
jgi:large subunit ribosomal protein L10